MSEADKIKNSLLESIHMLCAHCVNGNTNHQCALKNIYEQVSRINGLPLMVNNEFRGMIFKDGI